MLLNTQNHQGQETVNEKLTPILVLSFLYCEGLEESDRLSYSNLSFCQNREEHYGIYTSSINLVQESMITYCLP